MHRDNQPPDLLLSVGSEVQVLFGTPANNAESLCFQGFSAFLSNPVVITETELWFRISLQILIFDKP